MYPAVRVVVANELRSYREAIARAFEVLRQDVEVFSFEPEDLDREAARLRPALVVCSAVTPLVGARTPAWVELYPSSEARSRVCVRGETRTVEDVQLDDPQPLLDPPSTS